EQDEPSDRHVPRALMTERDGARVATAHARQLLRGVLADGLRHELLPQVHRPGLAERQHRGEHAHPHSPRAHERAAVDHADLRVLTAGGTEETDPSSGRMISVAGCRGRHDRALEEVSLPMQLLVTLERVQGLEHAKEGAGNHAASLARGAIPYALVTRAKEPRACSNPTTGRGRSRSASSRPTARPSVNPTSVSTPKACESCFAGCCWHALGLQRDRSTACSLAYFGDGSASEGDFHEGANLAGVFGAPVVLFCQNNGWAISVPTASQTAGEIWKRAEGYGFPGVRVDGNDVLAVYQVTRLAAARARAGDGPTLIEALTYRIGAHSTADDA